jgi:beta-glucosidase
MLPYQNPILPVEERIADLLHRMTLEEKIAQLGSLFNDGTLAAVLDSNGNFKEPNPAKDLLQYGIGHISIPSRRLGARQNAGFTNALQSYLRQHTRLGIPALCDEEALHGHVAAEATSFPQALALGSTWDPDLLEQIFTAVAREVRARGNHVVLSPVLDVARDPRFGRTEEMYGEDPYLVSRLGVAAIRGFQGRTPAIDADHVLATGKHFAAHSQPEGGLNTAPAMAAERTVRDVFLPPFKAAVTEAGIANIMPAYNEIDGIPCHANHKLLHSILREEWGFQGAVISDWIGIHLLQTHHQVVADEAEAARKALASGVDVELPSLMCYHTLIQQVRDGIVAEDEIDRSVERVLRQKFQLGLFENPFVDPDLAEQVVNCSEHQALALQAAYKSIILLKNEGNLLPLDRSKVKTLAVIGPNAAPARVGNYGMRSPNAIGVLDGLRQQVGKTIEIRYALGCRLPTVQKLDGTLLDDGADFSIYTKGQIVFADPAGDEALIGEAAATARGCDAALLVLGSNELTCHEGWIGYPGDRPDLELLGRQNDLVRAVLATGVPTIVFLLHGRPNAIEFIAGHVPAILEGWYLGQAGGLAVADVLFGDVNPGGKLTISIPRSAGHLPCYYNTKRMKRDLYLFSPSTPRFAFGHGLSYTTFEYRNLTVTPEKISLSDSAHVSVEVTNTGPCAGDEVVQCYVRDLVASVTRPDLELKGFRRITLQPGESQVVSFELPAESFEFCGEEMQMVIEPGWFEIAVGGSFEKAQVVSLQRI